MSKQLFVFKLIFRTRRKQCRQLGWKKIEQRPIKLRSITENDGRKTFWRKEFHHKLVQLTIRKQYWRPDRQKLVERTKKARSKPNDEIKKRTFSKKTSSKNHLGHVVSSLDKPVDCFLEKSLDLFAQGTQMINETNKVLTKRFYVLKLTLGLVECSVVNLVEKNEQRTINLQSKSEKDGRKNFWRKEFHHKLVQLTNRKQFWRADRQKLV